MIIAAKNKDVNERSQSSSGGIFPLLAKKILERGGKVYGVAFNDEFNVEHIAVDDIKDLPKLCGSKYTFSTCKVYADIKEDLLSGTQVLFTGTPCQVAALRAYLKQDYDNLFVVDHICHGAPPADIWMQYLKERSNGKKVSSVSFRNKENGWKNYRFVIRFMDGSEYAVDHDKDVYMRGFIDNITLREACYHCPFKGLEDKRKSDITLGDFWGAWDQEPELFDDTGTSLIFINSDKGHQLMDAIKDSIIWKSIDTEKAIATNQAAVSISKPNIFRKKFLLDYKKSGNLIDSLSQYAYPGILLKAYRKIYNILH